MKISTPIITIFVALLALAIPSSAVNRNWLVCSRRNSNIPHAIKAFCDGRPDHLHVPSPYARQGVARGNARVKIEGSCNPEQWVPHYWCVKQFLDICVGSPDPGGMGWTLHDANTNWNGCQKWIIEPA